MTFSITTALKTGMLTNMVTAAGATSTFVIYGGTPPADANASLSGNTVLVSCACSATPATVSTNVLTFNPVTSTAITTGGTATFFRWLASNGTTVLGQGTVGTSASDLIVGTTTLVSAAMFSVTADTVTLA